MSQGERDLQIKYQTKKRADAFYNNQMIDYINDAMQNFIKQQSFIFISTSDRHGNCDASFKAGSPGFLHIIDDKRLMYPEYRGNGVMASLGNITENPHIGLMLVDFTDDQVGLHINGAAQIVETDELSRLTDDDFQPDPRAERWVVITVDEAYIHCSKNIPVMSPNSETNTQQKTGDYFKVKAGKK